ncbi:MAG: hypothetical protein KIS73_13445 [Enhydrobacter sp.]|nr:hypothetical protein [Enhydrobacter sp.]
MKWLKKKAKRGVRAFPVGTVAFYGPTDRSASKVVAGVIRAPNADPVLRKWLAEIGDLREDRKVMSEVATFFRDNEVRSVGMIDGILGCPHEEGTDYPDGGVCPRCPFWAGRDRWSGLPKIRH